MTKKEVAEYFERGLELVGAQMSEQDREAVESCLRELKEGKQEEEEEKPWPQVGDEYYVLDSGGTAEASAYDDDHTDARRMAVGNFFKTYEEAEFASNRVHVLAEMRKFAEPFDTEWDTGKRHYYIYYGHASEELKVESHNVKRGGELYFDSEERANDCIEAVGEDRIKKYYLGVE